LDILLSKIIYLLKTKYNIDVSVLDERISEKKEKLGWNKGKIILQNNFRTKEGTLFMILHIFGHLVQYNLNNHKYKKLLKIINFKSYLKLETKDIISYKEKYFLYEQEAFMIGKSLLINYFHFYENLEDKYEAFLYADFDLYWNYILTNEINESIFYKTYNEKISFFKQNKLKYVDYIKVSPFNIGETKKKSIIIK